MSDFLAMGGYAGFIWPAYGISALVLIALVFESLAAYRRATRDVEALEAGTPVYSRKTGQNETTGEPGAGSAPETSP